MSTDKERIVALVKAGDATITGNAEDGYVLNVDYSEDITEVMRNNVYADIERVKQAYEEANTQDAIDARAAEISTLATAIDNIAE